MRKLLVGIVCAGLLATAQAQSVARVITPTPVSVVLTIGQWLMKDRKELYYIRVESRADSFDSAKQEGFRLAIEHAVGSLILSETEVRTGRLTRDDIITYSSGFVDQYKIDQQINAGGQVILQMQVWVAKSSIANRLLGNSTVDAQIDGDKIATQITTLTHERQAGDRVLSAVLADFPQRAFDVKVNQTRASYTSQRTGRLHVDYTISWNRDYIKSLSESLTAINQRSKCSRYSFRVHCIGTYEVEIVMPGFTSNVYSYFEDPSIEQQLRDLRMSKEPRLVFKFKDFDGNTVFDRCVPYLYNQWWYINFRSNQPANDVQINAGAKGGREMVFDLDPATIERINQVEISVVSGKECK